MINKKNKFKIVFVFAKLKWLKEMFWWHFFSDFNKSLVWNRLRIRNFQNVASLSLKGTDHVFGLLMQKPGKCKFGVSDVFLDLWLPL